MQTEPSAPNKRRSPFDYDDALIKRQRVHAPPIEIPVEGGGLTVAAEEPLNDFHVYRKSIQRSIGLALKHVGFDSASEEAMESFTQMVETCSSDTAAMK